MLIGLAVIAAALLLSVAALAEITSFILLSVFVLVNLALIRMKRQSPDASFRVPIWVPVAGFVLSLSALSVTIWSLL